MCFRCRSDAQFVNIDSYNKKKLTKSQASLVGSKKSLKKALHYPKNSSTAKSRVLDIAKCCFFTEPCCSLPFHRPAAPAFSKKAVKNRVKLFLPVFRPAERLIFSQNLAVSGLRADCLLLLPPKTESTAKSRVF